MFLSDSWSRPERALSCVQVVRHLSVLFLGRPMVRAACLPPVLVCVEKHWAMMGESLAWLSARCCCWYAFERSFSFQGKCVRLCESIWQQSSKSQHWMDNTGTEELPWTHWADRSQAYKSPSLAVLCFFFFVFSGGRDST